MEPREECETGCGRDGDMKAAAMKDAATVCKQAERIAALEDALLRMIRAYEGTNDSAPHRIAALMNAKSVLIPF